MKENYILTLFFDFNRLLSDLV